MILRWLASLLLILVLALLGAAGWIVGTEAGVNWLAQEGALLTGGAVHVSGLRGSVVDGMEIDEFSINAGATTVHGYGVRLQVLPAAFLRGRLRVPTLRVQRIELLLPPPSAANKEPFQMPRIAVRFPIDVEELIVGKLEFRRGDTIQVATGISIAGSMRGTRLKFRRLGGTIGGLALQGQGTVRLEPGLPLNTRVEWALADPALSGGGTLRGDLAKLEVSQTLRTPAEVLVSGTLFDLAATPRVTSQATWDLVQIPVPGVGVVAAREGRATLAGTLADWQATLATVARAEGYPEAKARATAHGDSQRVLFDELRLDGAFGTLAGTGDLTLVPDRRLRLDVAASITDTAAIRRGLKGNLSARVGVDAGLPGDVHVTLADLRGRLMGRPLSGSGEMTYGNGLLAFRGVDLRAGPNRLRADGSLGDRLSGRFDLAAPELAVLWPGFAGSVDAQATLAGSRAQPLIDLDARGHGLVLGETGVGELDIHARVDGRRRLNAQLAAAAVRYGAQPIGDLQARLEGTLDAHRLTAHLGGGPAEVNLASEGSWDGTTLHHRIQSASVAAAATVGEWRLASQPEIAVSSTAASIGDHCWEQAPASLCLSGLSWSPARTHMVGELRDYDMQRFDRWLPGDLRVSGRAYAAVALDVTEKGLSGSGIWRQEETTIYYTGGDEPMATPLETAQVAAQFLPGEVLATLEFDAGGGLHVSGNGRMQAPFGRDSAIGATLAGRLPDIAPFLPWLAGDLDLTEVAGGVTVDAAVKGTLRAPQVSGEARLSGGAVTLPGLGVKVEAIEFALLGDGGSAFQLKGSAKAGGPLTLDGEIRPIEEGGPAGWLRIRGQAVDAVRLPDRYIQASPDFTLRYAAGQLSTEGGIVIPKAEIVVRGLPESAASPSRDAVVQDREAPAEESGGTRVVGGELLVALGRDVHLKAFGLDTYLEGNVKLSQGADGEAKGYGVVRLREGKFGAYGKELTIERGTLGFAGPLDNPSIDIRATRQVDWEGKTVTAGILLSGTATNPESHVFSDPAMSQADALSYLISGRPMQSANATDRSAIAGAALSLGVQQTSPLTQALGSAVTLDELGMQGGTLDETEVVAGKQLNPDLYVRFTYGLFNRIGTVLARYKIGRNLSIEAASGEDQSLDLIYSVEKE